MKLSLFSSKNDVFVNFEYGIAFNDAALRDRCALLPVQIAIFGLSRDNCAHFDRFEYLLPHNSTA